MLMSNEEYEKLAETVQKIKDLKEDKDAYIEELLKHIQKLANENAQLRSMLKIK